MPVTRRNTPPARQLKEDLSVFNSLSKWTDLDESDPKSQAKKKKQYTELNDGDGENQGPPQPPPWWQEWVDVESDRFNMVIGVVIILNAVCIGFQTDFGDEDLQSNLDLFFLALECVFNTIFLIEMIVRLSQLGSAYFKDGWNLFDFFLVLVGSVQMFVVTPMKLTGYMEAQAGDKNNASSMRMLRMMRLVRILRLMRVLRVVRLFRMFHELNLMLQAFAKAFQVVMLISILVLILDYVLAILLTSNVGKSSADFGENAEQVERWFGSIANSMQTLFAIMTLSNWYEIAAVLSTQWPRGFIYLCFIMYIMVTSYTMMSLITGIISESLITSQQEYKHRKLTNIEKERKVLNAELKELFNGMHDDDDKDENGCVASEDLKKSLAYERTLTGKLAAIGISMDDDGVVQLIDDLSQEGKDGDQRVSIDYFVDKLTHTTGPATASLIVELRNENMKTQLQVAQLNAKLDQLLAKERDLLD